LNLADSVVLVYSYAYGTTAFLRASSSSFSILTSSLSSLFSDSFSSAGLLSCAFSAGLSV